MRLDSWVSFLFASYYELINYNCGWIKKHWKGYLTLSTVIFVGEMMYIFRDEIKDKLECKKSKEES